MPDNMISTAKSILGNEIWSEILDQNRSSPKRRFMPVERNSAQLCFFRRLTFSAELSLCDFFRLTFSASTGIFLLRPDTQRFWLEPAMPRERHRKKLTLSPS
jgi:hypothetical protein